MNLNNQCTATQSLNKGASTHVVMPGSADCFGTRGLVKMPGLVDGHPFESSFIALGDGRHQLPVKAELRKAIAKQPGDRVTVLLHERPERGGG